MLVDSPTIELHFFQDTGFYHFIKRTIDRGSTRLRSSRCFLEIDKKLLSIEVLMTSHDVINNHLTLTGDPLSSRLHKFGESFLRREGRVHTAKRKICVY